MTVGDLGTRLVKELLSGKDVMVILSTGFGKSLIYIHSLHFDKRIYFADIKNVPCDRFADTAHVVVSARGLQVTQIFSLVNLKHYTEAPGGRLI